MVRRQAAAIEAAVDGLDHGESASGLTLTDVSHGGAEDTETFSVVAAVSDRRLVSNWVIG